MEGENVPSLPAGAQRSVSVSLRLPENMMLLLQNKWTTWSKTKLLINKLTLILQKLLLSSDSVLWCLLFYVYI